MINPKLDGLTRDRRCFKFVYNNGRHAHNLNRTENHMSTTNDLTTQESKALKFIAGFQYGPQLEEITDTASVKKLMKKGLVRHTRRDGGVICTRRGLEVAGKKTVKKTAAPARGKKAA